VLRQILLGNPDDACLQCLANIKFVERGYASKS
jgi:hypothetical protein